MHISNGAVGSTASPTYIISVRLCSCYCLHCKATCLLLSYIVVKMKRKLEIQEIIVASNEKM
jgi:hypothetical protein